MIESNMAIGVTDTAIEHFKFDIMVLNVRSVDPNWFELWSG